MARSSGLETPQHAITDVYDTQSGGFLVRYSPRLIATLAITGVAAFAIAGFLGYPHMGQDFFERPWALYLWFSALVVTLLWSIFRNKALRTQLIFVLVITALCIILAFFVGDPTGALRRLLEKYLPRLAQEQLTYIVINFAVIAVFWVDTFRRWIRRAQGLRPHPVIDINTGEKIETAPAEELPSLGELVSGDFIAGAVLTGLLALLFQRPVISFITQTQLTDCSVSLSWPPSGCVSGATNVLASLTLIDQTQAYGYLSLGLLVLAVAASMGGLGAVGAAPMPMGVSREVMAVLAEGNPPATAPITTGVAETIIDALRSAFNRRIRELLLSIIRGVRNIAWPIFMFVTMFGIYQFASKVQAYLHGTKSLNNGLLLLLPATAWGLGAIVLMVLSAALIVFKWRVVTNTFQFLGLNGLILLLTFWIFSLAEWVLNKLFELIYPAVVRPFDPPLYLTAISFGAVIVVGAYLIISRQGLGFMTRSAARSQPTSGRLPAAARTTSRLNPPTTASTPTTTTSTTSTTPTTTSTKE